MSPTVHEIRVFAKANGIPVSKRGRVSRETVLAFLYANPAIVRSIANAEGIEVGKRGRMSHSVYAAVAGVL